MTKVCKQCFTSADDGAAFCDHCGAPLPLLDVCPSCGAHYLPGATHCVRCGLRLPLPTGVLGVMNPAPEPSSPREVSRSREESQPQVERQPARSFVTAHQVFPFPPGERDLIIGRADPGGFTPDIDTGPAGGEAAGVSRRHARVTILGAMAFIEDLGSTNFTYVNRQQLQPRQVCPLNPGDEVQLGRFILRYQVDE